MSRRFLPYILVAFCGVLPAFGWEVRGEVWDGFKEPAAGLQIKMGDTPETFIADVTVGNDGAYDFFLPDAPNRIWIRVDSPFYEPVACYPDGIYPTCDLSPCNPFVVYEMGILRLVVIPHPKVTVRKQLGVEK